MIQGLLFALTPMPDGMQKGAFVIALVIAVILHEVAHGYAALKLGDPTAKYAGRLTLNPIPHIDLWGTIVIPLLLIISSAGFVVGWAKPVPVNYYNLRKGKWGPVYVALAGPATNFVLLLIFGLLVRFTPGGTYLALLFLTIALVNGVLMLFNLIPLPPLDGSKVLYLFLDKRPDIIQFLERYSFFILLAIILLFSGVFTWLVFLPALQLTSFVSGISAFDIIRAL